jgi:cyclin-dependent kinase 2
MTDFKHVCSLENLLAFERSGIIPHINGCGKCVNIPVKCRYIVLEWLIDVRNVLKLKWDTWFNTVILLDRCFEGVIFSQDELQLYAITCLCIAAKKYEIYSPELSDYVYVCDGSYIMSDIINAEKKIFSIMNYNVDVPNIMEYIRYISGVSDTYYEVHNVTKILCICYVMFNIDVLPTVFVTAAHNIAIHIVNKSDGINPFLIDENVIDNISSKIQKRVCRINNNSILYKKIVSELKTNSPSLNWDTLVNMLQLLKFPLESISQSYIIPNNLTPKNYTSNRKGIRKIEKKEISDTVFLGEGTFGDVYKVKIDNEIYAKKKFKNSKENDGYSCSFVREISILQTLSHKNIIKPRYVIENSENIILDFMDSNMNDYIKNNNHIIHNQKFQNMCTEELLCGLSYMHSCGTIHRDIKPTNILVNGIWPDIIIKYCDFGGARGSSIIIHDASYTHEVCTLFYRAPEILLGSKTYGPNTDVWSLMCTLSEITTGTILFHGDSNIDQILKIFRVLGTPTNEVWHNVTSLSEYSRTFPKWKCNKDAIIKKSSPTSKIIYEGLIMDPVKRPSSKYLFALFQKFVVNI